MKICDIQINNDALKIIYCNQEETDLMIISVDKADTQLIIDALQNINVDYAYETIKEYESVVEIKTNDSFRIGWNMARITNAQLK